MLTEAQRSHAAAQFAAAAWSLSTAACQSAPRGPWINELATLSHAIYEKTSRYNAAVQSPASYGGSRGVATRFKELKQACAKWRSTYARAMAGGLKDLSWTRQSAIPKTLVQTAESGLVGLEKDGFVLTYSIEQKTLTVHAREPTIIELQYDHAVHGTGSSAARTRLEKIKASFPIPLNFGRMKLTFSLGNTDMLNYDAYINAMARCAFTGSKTIKSGNYYHPHVKSDGVVCLGDTVRACNNMFKSGSISEIVHIFALVCSNYNRHSPYIDLHRFVLPSCGACGGWECPPTQEQREDVIKKCFSCRRDVCRRNRCSEVCAETGNFACMSCLRKCTACSRGYAVNSKGFASFVSYPGKCGVCTGTLPASTLLSEQSETGTQGPST